ncbi:hypothetical protein [Hymenobacter sp. 5414T-23]|uniref:hypothetical protein n=1 Tax=Hymenobacter sp. 5414T-23 TaxID=2932252 RepID=UPI001FD32941|nr:hypothetical protein [Hymenobacter sp. 5414T-23]UOQ80539.1 hypothetical protein MUN83_17210 [Hymenobacter sp. 5414T-23]
MQPQFFTTPRTARYISLGEPGPGIQHIWFCLHGREQSLQDFANQLVNLDTPERLLVLPEGLSRYALPALETTPEAADTVASWFAPDSIEADLTDLTVYLNGLATELLAACPPTPPSRCWDMGMEPRRHASGWPPATCPTTGWCFTPPFSLLK